jgi:hypothetical protein
MDALWKGGLEDKGYSQNEIKRVVDFGYELSLKINPQLKDMTDEAKKIWDKRYNRGRYIVVETNSGIKEIRAIISGIAAEEGFYRTPKIISVWGGDKISIENIGPDVIKKLKKEINGDTFTFGTGTCFAVNNRDKGNKVTLEEIFKVLGI